MEYASKSLAENKKDGFTKWVSARLNNSLPTRLIDIYGEQDETLKALPELMGR